MANELPWFDQIAIASPCSTPWESMPGDDRVRFCRHCQKNVYNFSEMTREEVAEVIREKEGNLCGRMYRRPDGTLLTSDCPVGLGEVRRRLVRAACGIAATMLALIGGIAWGRSAAGKLPTGVSAIDEGPISKFANWVNPPEFFPVGLICVDPPELTSQNSPAEP